MKIFDLHDASGNAYAFEVSNTLLGRQRACRIAERIPGARITRRPRRWALNEPENFCEFELDGTAFAISEPFGDSSRYWIGPMPPHHVAALSRVRDAFARASGWQW